MVGTESHIAVQVNSGKAVEGNLQGNPNQSQRREQEQQAGSSVEAPGRLYQTKLECARVPDLDEGIGEYARNGFSDEYLHKVVRSPVQRAGSWIIHVLEDLQLLGHGLEARAIAKRVHEFDPDLPDALIKQSIGGLLAEGSLVQEGRRLRLAADWRYHRR